MNLAGRLKLHPHRINGVILNYYLIDQIVILLLSSIVFLIAYIGRSAIKRLDEHLKSCGDHNRSNDISYAVNQERLNSLTWEIKQIRTTHHWFGDCLQVLGTKLDVRLPQRPSTE